MDDSGSIATRTTTATLDVPPLHAAVWAGDLNRVRAILEEARATSASCSSNGSSQVVPSTDTEDDDADDSKRSALERVLEAKDARGNSALHLAVRLVQPAQRAIMQLLLVRRCRHRACLRLGS